MTLHSASDFIKFVGRAISVDPTTQNPILVEKTKQIYSLMSELNGYYKTWEVFEYQNDWFNSIRFTANTLIGLGRVILIIPTFGLVELAIKNYCIKTAYKLMRLVQNEGQIISEPHSLTKKMMDTAFAAAYFWRLIICPNFFEIDSCNFEVSEGTIEDHEQFLEHLGEIRKHEFVKNSIDFKLQPLFWERAEADLFPNHLHCKKALPPRYVYESVKPPLNLPFCIK